MDVEQGAQGKDDFDEEDQIGYTIVEDIEKGKNKDDGIDEKTVMDVNQKGQGKDNVDNMEAQLPPLLVEIVVEIQGNQKFINLFSKILLQFRNCALGRLKLLTEPHETGEVFCSPRMELLESWAGMNHRSSRHEVTYFCTVCGTVR